MCRYLNTATSSWHVYSFKLVFFAAVIFFQGNMLMIVDQMTTNICKKKWKISQSYWINTLYLCHYKHSVTSTQPYLNSVNRTVVFTPLWCEEHGVISFFQIFLKLSIIFALLFMPPLFNDFTLKNKPKNYFLNYFSYISPPLFTLFQMSITLH